MFRNRKFYFCGAECSYYYLSGLSLVDSSSCVHIHTYNIFHRFSVINSPQIRHKLPTKSKIFEIVVKKFVKLKVAKCTCLVSLFFFFLSLSHINTKIWFLNAEPINDTFFMQLTSIVPNFFELRTRWLPNYCHWCCKYIYSYLLQIQVQLLVEGFFLGWPFKGCFLFGEIMI